MTPEQRHQRRKTNAARTHFCATAGSLTREPERRALAGLWKKSGELALHGNGEAVWEDGRVWEVDSDRCRTTLVSSMPLNQTLTNGCTVYGCACITQQVYDTTVRCSSRPQASRRHKACSHIQQADRRLATRIRGDSQHCDQGSKETVSKL